MDDKNCKDANSFVDSGVATTSKALTEEVSNASDYVPPPPPQTIEELTSAYKKLVVEFHNLVEEKREVDVELKGFKEENGVYEAYWDSFLDFADKVKGICGYMGVPPPNPDNPFFELIDVGNYLEKFTENLKKMAKKGNGSDHFGKPDPNGKFGCQRCESRFTLLCWLRKHMETAHGDPNFFLGYPKTCTKCGRPFKYVGEFNAHKKCSGPTEALTFFREDSPSIKGYYFVALKLEAPSVSEDVSMDADVNIDDVTGKAPAGIGGFDKHQDTVVEPKENVSNVPEIASTSMNAHFSGFIAPAPRIGDVVLDVGVTVNEMLLAVEQQEEAQDDDQEMA